MSKKDFIDSELVSRAAAALQEEIIKELKIKDPSPEEAKARVAKGCCQGRKDCKNAPKDNS